MGESSARPRRGRWNCCYCQRRRRVLRDYAVRPSYFLLLLGRAFVFAQFQAIETYGRLAVATIEAHRL